IFTFIAAASGRSESLRLMTASAKSGNFGIRQSGKRVKIVDADFPQMRFIGLFKFLTSAVKPERCVEEHALGLPWRNEFKLLRKLAGISGKVKRFDAQHSRRGVMSMRCPR